MTRDAASMLDRAREQAEAMATLANSAEKVRREAILAAVDAQMSRSEVARRLGISEGCVIEIIDQTIPRDAQDRAADALVRWDSQNADPELLTGPLAMRPGPEELAGLLRELLTATAKGATGGDGDEGARIENFEQLAALPVGAVIFDLENGQAAQREMDGWYYTGDGNGYQIVQLPAILLRISVASANRTE